MSQEGEEDQTISSVPSTVIQSSPSSAPSFSFSSPLLSASFGLCSSSYLSRASDSFAFRHRFFSSFLTHRRLPADGWKPEVIEEFVHFLSSLDSNNHLTNVGAGEREGRVHSILVRRRNYSFAHGVGRSGDLTAQQPKAAGSNILISLTHRLTLHAIHLSGYQQVADILLFPCATGFTLSFVLSALKRAHEKEFPAILPVNRYVLFFRIDQKTCIKCINTAGLNIKTIEGIMNSDGIHSNLQGLKEMIELLGRSQIVCVFSTISCFAPRAPDKIDEIALLCKEFNLAHVVNNAYGLSVSSLSQLMNRAMRIGRVDCFVSSLDKNFLVPVAGALIAVDQSHLKFLKELAADYPGRASASAIIDLFLTLMELGESGWKALIQQREEEFLSFRSQLSQLASKLRERLLNIPENTISLAMSLNQFPSSSSLTALGSMLFTRSVTGPRVFDIHHNQSFHLGDLSLQHFGSHSPSYPSSFITLACAIGQKPKESQQILAILEKTFKQFIKQTKKGTMSKEEKGTKSTV
jgi:O-phospho-L-seryl-tRNASec:L-selenocysteinyl-tRNA synthase